MTAPQPLWDVFHSERLEAERSLTTQTVLEALAKGSLTEDDLVRPSGDTRWTRIGDSPEFGPLGTLITPDREAEFPASFATFEPPTFEEMEDEDDAESDHGKFEPDRDSFESLDREALRDIEDDDAGGEFQVVDEPEPEAGESDQESVLELEPEDTPTAYREASSVAALPVLPDEETQASDLPELVDEAEFEVFDYDEELHEEAFEPLDEDDEAAEFTLSRNAAEKVEELDLAAMVDVAFQLVLFFLVTAQVVLFKTLEIPRPNEDKPPEAAAQARSKSVDELEKDYILVEVDAGGAIRIDHQPVTANRPALVEKLRTARESTQRKAMLLSADFATQHKNAVLVFDVANEIDLKIAIAQPSGKK